jgi:glycosyltransferase involved in cell wall biosynthesis
MCEMQVCHLHDKEAIAAGENVHFMAALSPWHKGFMVHSGIPVPEDNFVVFPNGINLSRYPRSEFEAKLNRPIGKDPLFVYSSSPDRGLLYLLQSWPYIREAFPEAQLKVGYGATKWTSQIKWSHGKVGEMAVDIEVLMKQPGVEDIGKIGQDVLSMLQMEADAWLYPLDAQSPTESGCITAIENAAAGNPIITTDCDCMEDQFGEVGIIVDLPFNPKVYADTVIETLSDQGYVEFLRNKGREFAETRDWKIIAEQWEKFFIHQS